MKERDQATALLREALGRVLETERTNPRVRAPVARRTRLILEREISRLASYRHDDRAVWRSLRRAANAIMDLIER